MFLYCVICFILIGHYTMQPSAALKSVEGIDFLGRFHVAASQDDGKPAQYTADWSGSGIRFSVLAKSAKVLVSMSFLGSTVSSSFLYYVGMFVDGKLGYKYEVNNSQLRVDFAYDSIPGRTNEITMRKLTEASFSEATGNMTLGELEVTGGAIVQSTVISSNRKRKIFVVGDSITCGYGVRGKNARCGFSAITEDVTQSFAFLLAARLKLDVDVICWSGLGVVRNYGDPKPLSDLPMTSLYNRTLATVSPSGIQGNNNKSGSYYWHPHLQPADLVLIALGTNDYSTKPFPPSEEFIRTYVSLVRQIQRDHPQAKVLATCEPMTRHQQCHNIQQAAATSNVSYFEISPKTLSGGKGCHFHPNRASQQNIADALLLTVRDLIFST